MFKDKPFRIALLISVAAHSMTFAPWQGLPFGFPAKIKETTPELTYFRPPKNVAVEALTPKDVVKSKAAPAPKKAGAAPKFEAKDAKALLAKKVELPKEPPMPQILPAPKAIKQEIKPEVIPLLEEESLKKSPFYLNYYQNIRSELRTALSNNYRGQTKKGEIYVNFVVRSNGRLLSVIVDESKSTPNVTLREIVFKSFKEASPFPPFPQELPQSQITFNVGISFKAE